MTTKKGILIFLTITFGISWALFAVIKLCGGVKNQVVFGTLAALAMLAPAAGAIIARKLDKDAGFKDSRWKPSLRIKHYLSAYGLTIGYIILWYLSIQLFGMVKNDFSLSEVYKRVPDLTISPQGLFVISLLSSLFLSPFLNLFFTLGEEYGWRDYLFSKLLPLGVPKAVIISGAIWGIWHIPLVLMGFNYPGHPYTGVLLEITFSILFGFLLCGLYLKGNSVFLPALSHALANAVGQSILYQTFKQIDPVIAGMAGLLGQFWLLVLGIIFWKVAKPSSINKP